MWSALFRKSPRRNRVARLAQGGAFSVAHGETLLEAALRAGFQAPHNCRVGACGTCRCRLLEGRARSLIDRAYILPPEEIERGVFLACQTLPDSDVRVDWTMQGEAPASRPGWITALRPLTPRVWRVSIAASGVLAALPGQHVAVTVDLGDDGAPRRHFSLVSVAHDEGQTFLEIDIARRESGLVSRRLSDTRSIGLALQIEGPFGDCVPDERDAPLVAVGAGSGIGAALGAIRYSHGRRPQRPTALLAYGQEARELYGLHDAIESASRAGAVHVSRAWAERGACDGEIAPGISSGRAPAGLAEAIAAVRELDTRGREPQVLLFGPPGFVDVCVECLSAAGVSAASIRFDRYQPSGAAVPVRITEELIIGG